ncbi:hypothetical protein TOPH_03276 [Tolypocladium ophioglossoides CBS 100239]|uniref:Fatty acid hydroxylase domain-containing protein n=1 Tax=Tolypocladium ophioglossoides (strain CBS 100239) TaxID=1163406 RepID=A0A0L0ND93_TOLOC|nr:hypothetical protein TOPH_03276 [Tolypocladium ophioglossoides CBS 100239]
MAAHLAMLFSAREALTYYIHRFVLHGHGHGRAARLVARPHRQYAHASSGAPYSLQLFTDHPLPLLLHRLVPLYVPALLLRPHLLTYLLFVALCTVEETVALSGYAAVPGIVMSRLARRAAVHVNGRGVANFSAWGVLDWVHGTGRGPAVLEHVRREADRHHVVQRAKSKTARGAGLLQSGLDAIRGGTGKSRMGTTKKKTARR